MQYSCGLPRQYSLQDSTSRSWQTFIQDVDSSQPLFIQYIQCYSFQQAGMESTCMNLTTGTSKGVVFNAEDPTFFMHFLSTELEVPEHVQPTPVGSFLQSNWRRSIKFLHPWTDFLNFLQRNSYPSVDCDQRTLQKSYSKSAGKWGATSNRPAVLITGHHNATTCTRLQIKKPYGNQFLNTQYD